MLAEGRLSVHRRDFQSLAMRAHDPAGQLGADDLPRHPSGATYGALPDDRHPPSIGHEGIKDTGIPLTVPFDLHLPEVRSRAWQPEQGASLMAVPEAAMEENRNPVPRQDEIWPAGQLRSEGEPQAEPVKPGTKKDFRPGIRSPDTGHHPAAHLRGNDVGHQAAKRRGLPASASMRDRTPGTIARATASNTGTATALPNCL